MQADRLLHSPEMISDLGTDTMQMTLHRQRHQHV